MRENNISVVINRAIEDVFLFTITPSNTSSWIPSIEREETDEWPVKIGSRYKSVGKDGHWSEYVVTDIQTNRIFELVSKDGNYHVRYTYSALTPSQTQLEYFEWMNTGDLKDPFEQIVLDNLKNALEMKWMDT